MHAKGIENGNRYRWAHYYEAPELDALIGAETENITWEELDHDWN